MSWFDKIPTMERQELRDLKKYIDISFKDFSRTYGDGIESFFDPLLYFLVWFEKLLINAPWPLIIFVIAGSGGHSNEPGAHACFIIYIYIYIYIYILYIYT